MSEKCQPHPLLFEIDDEARIKKTRSVARSPVRAGVAQVHLPIFNEEEQRENQMLELLDAHRPLTRADCQEEARPCPYSWCPWHLFHGRFELYERVLDRIEPGPDEAIEDAVSRMIGENGWPVGVVEEDGKILFERIELRDGLHKYDRPALAGPLPTCALDVAEQVKAVGGELTNEDVSRLTGQTREGVRVLIKRVGPVFVRHHALRPWLLEIATEEEIADLAAVNYFGGD
jgi:hypothetical protein